MRKLLDMAKAMVKRLNLTDFAFLLMVLSICTFYDYRRLAVVFQFAFLACIFVEMLVKKVPLFQDKTRVKMIVWYLVFFVWAELSFLWADVHITFVQMLISLAQVAAIGIGVSFYIRTPERLRFAFVAMAFAAYVFCVRFILAVPPWVWAEQSRIGVALSFGSNRGPVFLSYAALMHIYYAISRRKWGMYLPAALFILVAILFGTRTVLVFLFAGSFFIILARSKTRRQFANQGIVLLAVTAIFMLAVLNVNFLYRVIGRRIMSVNASLVQREALSEYEKAVMAAEAEALAREEEALLAASVTPPPSGGQTAGQTQGETTTGTGTDVTITTEVQQPEEILTTEAPIVTPVPPKKRASSALTRMTLIETAIDAFKEQPITGIGLDNFRFISHPHYTFAHNTQLELLANLGLVGFLLYYSFLAYLALKAWLNREKTRDAIIVFAFIASMFISDLFSISYVNERDHVFLGAMAAIMMLQHINKQIRVAGSNQTPESVNDQTISGSAN